MESYPGKMQLMSGKWVQSRSCRCGSLAEATVPSSPWVWTRTRPIAISPTVLVHVGRAHLQHRLRSPLLSELLRPLGATVHRLDHAFARHAAVGQTQAAVTRVIHPLSVGLHIPQLIRRDLPRIVVRAVPWRRPQFRAARWSTRQLRLVT